MTGKVGFDNEKYIEEQSAEILQRVGKTNSRLYLEFGGKLLYDYHAARVLPGYDPNVKLRLLQHLKDKVDLLLCIFAGDIERKKIRADFGITYDADALKLIDDLRNRGAIFIAEHGSWNRGAKAGYKVSVVRLDARQRVVAYEDFATGWVRGEAVSGRPADVLVMPDGSLLVSDDHAGAIYRIRYRGAR